jgi:hypothetical protein
MGVVCMDMAFEGRATYSILLYNFRVERTTLGHNTLLGQGRAITVSF